MNYISIVDSYYVWITDLVCSHSQKKLYSKLLHYLNSVEFTYLLPMDQNRYEDGLSLRWRYSRALHLDRTEVSEALDEPCSVLEMMVALSVRCEEEIKGGDVDLGDRTPVWFWTMIDSLGLLGMTNDSFDIDEVEFIISRFLNREYEHNGKGGLFTIPYISDDLRNVEIWDQLNWYVSPIT